MIKKCKPIVIFVVMSMLIPVFAVSALAATVVETYTGEDSITAYVKGVDPEVTEIDVQIGTAEAKGIEKEQVSAMKTLVLVDNSLSIPNADRAIIKQFLQDFIADKKDAEQILIGTFSDQSTYMTDYTDDYTTLKSAVDRIEYQDQETYLTDVLYDILSKELIPNPEDVYRRIVIVSDGVDNKAIGYTKDELYSLIKASPIPIYTLGCKTGKNNEQLENMFALSRMTGVNSYVVGDIANTGAVVSEINGDRNNLKIRIIPDAESLDGSEKNIKLTMNEESINFTAKMPQKLKEKVTPEPTATPEPEQPKKETETKPVKEKKSQKEKSFLDSPLIPFVLLGLGILLLGGIAAIIIIRKVKKNNEFEAFDSSQYDGQFSLGGPQGDKTELLSETSDNGDSTVMLFSDAGTYTISLTDVNSPIKSFQVPLTSNVVIGRKADSATLVVDYDKSISSRHCEIYENSGRIYIRDLQSANGTFVNGSRITSETEIISGNIIRLGRTDFRFELR